MPETAMDNIRKHLKTLKLSRMDKALDDPVVTAAMVDRMVHHAVIINIDGPNWRMHESKRLNRQSRKQNPAKKTK